VGMLGGGNRGRGVGNEPSRSLRGSGVVARLLRSELSAEHFSLPRVPSHSAQDLSTSASDLIRSRWRQGAHSGLPGKAIRTDLEWRPARPKPQVTKGDRSF
jgi:hypothetical protein